MGNKDVNYFKKRTIALVYDFDGTLCPDAMQNHGLLPSLGLDNSFWATVKTTKEKQKSVEILTYMHLLQQEMLKHDVNWPEQLSSLGENIPLFPGVLEWFDAIDGFVKKATSGRLKVEHYVISSGLEEMITGNYVGNRVKKVFASSYNWNQSKPESIRRAITDASKPQYIFRINKGKEDYNENINDHMSEEDRPIPFKQIIFFGDGETDIPCMTVTTKNGGYAIGVYDQNKIESKIKCIRLYEEKRITFFAEANFTAGSELYRRTEIILKKIIADIRLDWANHLFRERVLAKV